MAATVTVSDVCKNICDQIQKGEKYRYAILEIKNDRVFEVASKGERGVSYDTFLNDLMKSGQGVCRYIVYYFELDPQTQICCLISWMPANANLKDKIMYSAYFIALKTCLGIEECLDANSEKEITKEFVEEQLRQRLI